MKLQRIGSFLVMASSFVALAGCVTAEQAAIQEYLLAVEPLAEEMSETGAKFETLMNANPNPLNWSEAQKTELGSIIDTMNRIQTGVQGITPPAAFTDAHPLLLEALGEMTGAMDIISGIAENPSTVTDATADELVRKAERGEELANQFVEKLEETLREKYPEMLEE